MNSNHTNISLERDMIALKARLSSRFFDLCGYPTEILLDRLIQVVVQSALGPYATQVRSCNKDFPNKNIKSPNLVKCKGFEIQFQKGRLRLMLKQWILNQIIFLKHWLYVLYAIFFFDNQSKIKNPTVIGLDIPEESILRNGSDLDFADFCLKGPIEPFRKAKHILIQFSHEEHTSRSQRIKYSKNPLLTLIKSVEIGGLKRIELFGKHLWHLIKYLVVSSLRPEISLISRDFAYSDTLDSLNKLGFIQAVMLTTGSYVDQSLWIRGITRENVHMVWYSQSAQLITYKDDGLHSYIPNYRWMYVGIHWVWTKGLGQYICGINKYSTYNVVGPILWYLPLNSTKLNNRIRLVAFDVPPFSHEYSLAHLGVFPNYYSPENMFSFIEGLIDLKQFIENRLRVAVELLIKIKRKDKGWVIHEYNKYLFDLNKKGVLSVIASESNIYELISGCDLVIAYPFSSPPYVAESLATPSIYYDPTNTVVRHDFCNSQEAINFAGNIKELKAKSIAILENKMRIISIDENNLDSSNITS